MTYDRRGSDDPLTLPASMWALVDKNGDVMRDAWRHAPIIDDCRQNLEDEREGDERVVEIRVTKAGGGNE